MTRKRECITLSLSPEQKLQLEQIAWQFRQTWGEQPNISKLMRAIADGELQVSLSQKPHH